MSVHETAQAKCMTKLLRFVGDKVHCSLNFFDDLCFFFCSSFLHANVNSMRSPTSLGYIGSFNGKYNQIAIYSDAMLNLATDDDDNDNSDYVNKTFYIPGRHVRVHLLAISIKFFTLSRMLHYIFAFIWCSKTKTDYLYFRKRKRERESNCVCSLNLPVSAWAK